MLTIDIEPTKGILFVRLKGKLERRDISKLNNEVIKLIKTAGIKNILYNINELEYIDNYGKNALKNSFIICSRNKGQRFICDKKNQLKTSKIKNVKLVKDELTAIKIISA